MKPQNIHGDESFYYSLFNAMTEGFALCELVSDKNGKPCDYRFLDVNPAFERFCGIKKKDIVGKLRSQIPMKINPLSFNACMRVALSGKPKKLEGYQEKLKKYYSIHIFRFSPNRFVYIFNDVTSQRQIREKLRKTQDYLEKLINYANAPIIVWNTDFKITKFNHAFERLTGLKSGQVINRRLEILFPNDSRKESLKHIKRTLLGEHWKAVEIPIRKTDGSIKTVLWNSANIYEKDGLSVAATIAQGQDITERKIKEKKLEMVNRMLKALNDISQATLNAEDESSYLKDVCKIIISASNYKMIWIGFAQNDPQKSVKPVASAGFEKGYLKKINVTWSNGPLGRGPIGSAIRTGKTYYCKNILSDPSFEIWRTQAAERGYASVLALPLRHGKDIFGAIAIYSSKRESFSDDDIQLFQELADDIASGVSSLRLKEAKKLAEKDLRRSNAEKNKFIRTTSHELRNLSTPIVTGIELIKNILEQKMKADSRLSRSHALVYETVNIINQQTDNMTRLLDDMLDISRISLGKINLKKEKVILGKAIEQAVNSVEKLVKSQKHTLTIAISDPEICVFADPVRLQQILINLLNNAIKYTPPQGKIRIKTSRKNNHALISVRDNGIGIAANKISSLFASAENASSAKPFVSTQGEIGVGLRLVENLVFLHNGTVVAKSKGINLGCEFIVSLPVMACSQGSQSAPDEGNLAKILVKNKLRVLLVDDNVAAADLTAKFFNTFGHSTRVCQNGPAALKIARRYKPRIVLIDIEMPGMNGYELARNLRQFKNGGRMKLIAVTGYGQKNDIEQAKAAGFDLYLIKPIDFKTMQQSIVNLMQNEPPE